MDIVTALSISLVGIAASILTYHFFIYNQVRSAVLQKVSGSLENLWDNKLAPKYADYVNQNLVKSTAALNSYLEDVQPTVDNSLNLLQSAEEKCTSRAWVYFTEIFVVATLSIVCVWLLSYAKQQNSLYRMY